MRAAPALYQERILPVVKFALQVITGKPGTLYRLVGEILLQLRGRIGLVVGLLLCCLGFLTSIVTRSIRPVNLNGTW